MKPNRRDHQHPVKTPLDTAPSSDPHPEATRAPVRTPAGDARPGTQKSAAEQAVENQQRALESGEENPG